MDMITSSHHHLRTVVKETALSEESAAPTGVIWKVKHMYFKTVDLLVGIQIGKIRFKTNELGYKYERNRG